MASSLLLLLLLNVGVTFATIADAGYTTGFTSLKPFVSTATSSPRPTTTPLSENPEFINPFNYVIPSNCSSLAVPVSEADVTNAIFKHSKSSYWDRPVRNVNKSVAVSMEFAFRKIIDIEERSQLIQISGYLNIKWRDEFHVWNDTFPLSCVESLVLPHGKETGIWLPDVAFTTSDSKYRVTRSAEDLIRIRSDGAVFYSPGGVLDFHCNFDLALFPFDSQICSMQFENWRYQSKYQHFLAPGIYFDEELQSENEQWTVDGTNLIHKDVVYVTGNFSLVIFQLKLRRKVGYYALTVIMPCILIAIVEIVTFALPFEKGYRLEVSFTCLLAFSVFQASISNELPHSADRPPLLLLMINLFTLYIVVAIAMQGLCILLAYKEKRAEKVPRSLLHIVSFMAPFVLLPKYPFQKEKKKATTTQMTMSLDRYFKQTDFIPSSTGGSANKNDSDLSDIEIDENKSHLLPGTDRKAWHYLARVADRYGLVIFVALLLATVLATLVIVPAIRGAKL